MVLDGQQRLQSLYIALGGSHLDRPLYVDVVNSGVTPEDVSDRAYSFAFMKPSDAECRNNDSGRQQQWIALAEIMRCKSIEDADLLAEQCAKRAGADPYSTISRTITKNIHTMYARMKADQVLNYYLIDKDYGDVKRPMPIAEVLEVFVRINSGGEVLTKSDLMFSLMQLQWEDAYDQIQDIRQAINLLGDFDFSRDFILRCALVCCGRGARYDVDKLREPGTLRAIRDGFTPIGRAIEETVRFLVHDARILDGRILGSANALIPFVYYVFGQPNQNPGSEGNRMAMKHAPYLALMSGVFARFPDSRIDAVVREVFEPALQAGRSEFPLDSFCHVVGRREGRSRIDDWLLQRNVLLLMNIIEQGVILPPGLTPPPRRI